MTSHMQTLLGYWFEHCDTNHAISRLTDLDDVFARWFGRKEDEVQLHLWKTCSPEAENWPHTPLGEIARVVLYDQLPRGCFRGTPHAFRYEDQALTAASRFLDYAYPFALSDRSIIPVTYIQIALICLSHIEDAEIQGKSVQISHSFSEQVNQQGWLSPVAKKQLCRTYPEALDHQEIISAYGRFPHRNPILGRPSSAEELQFLRQEGLPAWMASQKLGTA